MTALFAAIIVLLSRLVHAWFFSKEELEAFDDSEEGREDSALYFPGDLNYQTGKPDSGLEWGGQYEADRSD